ARRPADAARMKDTAPTMSPRRSYLIDRRRPAPAPEKRRRRPGGGGVRARFAVVSALLDGDATILRAVLGVGELRLALAAHLDAAAGDPGLADQVALDGHGPLAAQTQVIGRRARRVGVTGEEQAT